MKVIIKDCPPYSGEYDLETPLTFRQRRRVKEVSGYVGIEQTAAIMRDDPDAALAFAVVALEAAGKFTGAIDVDLMLDTRGLYIGLDFRPEEKILDDEEAKGPLERRPTEDESRRNGSEGSGSSGGNSSDDGDLPTPSVPSDSGRRG